MFANVSPATRLVNIVTFVPVHLEDARLCCDQGVSVDMDDGYDLAATAEETRRQRQRELEVEAEQRVSTLLPLARICRRQQQSILSSLNLTPQASVPGLVSMPCFVEPLYGQAA